MIPARSANPFVGLRPFDRGDAHLFFGRDEQLDVLTSRLHTQRFVAVMGTSGSGKSSLVRSGLLPALEGGLVTNAESAWSIVTMTPGANPIGNLAAALVHAGVVGARSGQANHEVTTIETILRRGALGLVDAVSESRLASADSLLILGRSIRRDLSLQAHCRISCRSGSRHRLRKAAAQGGSAAGARRIRHADDALRVPGERIGVS